MQPKCTVKSNNYWNHWSKEGNELENLIEAVCRIRDQQTTNEFCYANTCVIFEGNPNQFISKNNNKNQTISNYIFS